MSEQAKITTLTDHEGNPIAPRTAANAVSYGDQTVGGALDTLREETEKAGEHANNTDVHITAEERIELHGKADGNHTHTAVQVGALPIAGGTLTGNVEIRTAALPQFKLTDTGNGSRSIIVAGTHNIQLQQFNSTESSADYRRLILFDSAGASNTERMLTLNDTVSGTNTSYIVYGEHNITVSTAAPASALANGAMHMVY